MAPLTLRKEKDMPIFKSKFFLFTLLFFLQLVLSSTSLFARRVALLIATNYKGNQVGTPPLKQCERDARLIKKSLLKHGKFEEIEVLLGSMVTGKNISNSLFKLNKGIKSHDTFLIYFSGHGTYQSDSSSPNGMRNFLLMYRRPHLPDNLLDSWIRKIKTKKLVWIFDACHSGGIAGKSKLTRGSGRIPISKGQRAKVIENGDENLFFGNRAMLGSSSANETAIEVGSPINHGIFSYFFAKSLEPKNGDLNHDGTVTLLEAFSWSKPRVIEMAERYKHRQSPLIGGRVSGIYLAGKQKPKPPPAGKPLVLSQAQAPKPAPVKPPHSVIYPADPIEAAEPPVIPHKKRGKVLIYTTIYKSTVAGPTPTDPNRVIARNKKPDETRKISISLSSHKYPLRLEWLNEKQLSRESGEHIPLGRYSHRGKSHKNRIAKITIEGVPTGVHEIILKADAYPVIKERLGVEAKAKYNKLFIVASLAGYGTIRGKVFLRSFEKPLAKHRIYMPVIKQTKQIHSMLSAKDGSFWFLNLLPAKDYFIKSSFAENLPLDNKKLHVKANATTNVDVVLSRK